ncbi:MAG: alpha/beta hydrolase, partial [bacterium]
FNQDWVPYADAGDKGINREDTEKFLMGPDGWNAAQGNALDGIPVTLLAGSYFQVDDGDPTVWPNDATVSRSSAWAERIPDALMPIRTRWEGPLVHSIFTCNYAGLDWQRALTWNVDALARVSEAIDAA